MKTVLFALASFLCVAADPVKPDEKKILESLQGEWIVEKLEIKGKVVKDAKDIKMTIEKSIVTIHIKEKKEETIKINVSKTPMQMDNYEGDTIVNRSIFEIDGDTLKICGGGSTQEGAFKDGKVVPGKTTIKDRPTKFDSNQGELTILKRVKK